MLLCALTHHLWIVGTSSFKRIEYERCCLRFSDEGCDVLPATAASLAAVGWGIYSLNAEYPVGSRPSECHLENLILRKGLLSGRESGKPDKKVRIARQRCVEPVEPAI